MLLAMSQHIVDLIQARVTKEELETLATAIGEPIDRTRVAVGASIDAIVASLAQRVASRAGAGSVGTMLHSPMFGSVDGLWTSFLGEEGERVDDLAAEKGGIARAAAHRLVAALLPIVASVLMEERGQEANDDGRSADELQKFFGARRASAKATHVTPKIEPVIELATAPRTKPVWLPLAVVLGALALGTALLLRPVPPATTAIPEPVPVAGAPEPTSVTSTTSAEAPKGDPLVQAFESAETPPKVILEGVSFEPRTANVQSGKDTIDELAMLMKEHPSSKVRIEGHTDNTGRDDANETLSLHQAAAVKAQLVAEGVSSDRIEVVGMGARVPTASNDTEGGRAKNRRIEVEVVTQ